MIYSKDISKICALCRHADKLFGTDDEIYCNLQMKNMNVSSSDCDKFDYDIFKKTVHRKKRLKTDFSADDFSID